MEKKENGIKWGGRSIAKSSTDIKFFQNANYVKKGNKNKRDEGGKRKVCTLHGEISFLIFISANVALRVFHRSSSFRFPALVTR